MAKIGGVPPAVAAAKAKIAAEMAAANPVVTPAPDADPLTPIDAAPVAPAPASPAPVTPPPALTSAPLPPQSPVTLNEELDFSLPNSAPAPIATTSTNGDATSRLEAGLNTAITALQAAETERKSSAAREEELRREIQELKSRPAASPTKTREQAQAELAALDITAEELTPEEMESYTPATRNLIAKMVKAELARIAPFIKDASLRAFDLTNEFGSIKSSTGANSPEFASLAQQQATLAEEQFIDRMKNYVTNGNPVKFDSIVKSPQWKSYLTRPVKGGSTVAGVLQQFHENRDLGGLSRIFSAFVSANPYESLVLPSSQSASGASGGGTAPKQVTMKLSQLTEMQNRFQKKQIPKAQLDTFRQEFEKAKGEGRVDMQS